MKRLNNKGFAASTLLYVLIIMMFLIVLALMSTLGTTRKNTKNLGDVIEDELNRYGLANQSFSYDSSVDIEPRCVLILKAGWYKIELWGPGTTSTGGGHTEGIIYLEKDEMLYVHLTPETGTLKSSYITWNEDDDDHIIMKTPEYNDENKYLISGYAGYDASDTIINANKRFYFSEIEPETNHGKSKFKMSIISEGNTQPFKRDSNSKTNKVRYIKDCASGDINNQLRFETDWIEIQAMYNGKNIAKNKTITWEASDGVKIAGDSEVVTDGKPYSTSENDYFAITNSNINKLKCVIVDLENLYDLDEIAVWHHHITNVLSKKYYIKYNLLVSQDNTTYTTLIPEWKKDETVFGIRFSDAYIQ